MTKEKILDKLAKIRAQAVSAENIGNTAEAEAFASMLNNLLLKHKLELTDVEYHREQAAEPIITSTPGQAKNIKGHWAYKDAAEVEIRKTRVGWQERLAAIVARANNCQTLATTGSSIVTFVGHKSNVAISEYMFVTLTAAADRLSYKAYCDNYYRLQEEGRVTENRGYRAAWIFGFVGRVTERLNEERRRIEAELYQNTGNKHAMVRLNREAEAVSEYLGAMPLKKVRSAKVKFTGHRDGHRDGRTAANQVRLGKKVDQLGGGQ